MTSGCYVRAVRLYAFLRGMQQQLQTFTTFRRVALRLVDLLGLEQIDRLHRDSERGRDNRTHGRGLAA